MSRIAEHARFLATFLRNPRTTGSVIPSSRALGRRMTEALGLEQARTILEVGPGTGAFTGEIIDKAGGGAKVIAVELDAGFAATLTRRFPGLDVANDSAEELPRILASRNLTRADAVVCSLPWTNLPDEVTDRILAAIHQVLKPGGAFATYVYLSGVWMPAAWRFRNRLRNTFGNLERSPVVWGNVPPAFVCRCRKQG